MYEYAAVVERVQDGDSVVLDIDLGFSVRLRASCRLYGINAPEMVGESKAKGEAAKAALAQLLPAGARVSARTHKDREDKYGRILVELWAPGQAASANDRMVELGHAVPYFGGPR